MNKLTIKPAWKQKGFKFKHTWNQYLNVDQFRWLVRKDMLDQLAVACRELGGKHVRAVGILDDELRVAGPIIGGQTYRKKDPVFNWQIVDYIIDNLLEIGVKPVITPTFIPSRLASGKQTVFTTNGIVSPPRKMRDWTELVTALCSHLRKRYGAGETRTWYYEVWNEPNLDAFWGGSQNDFFKLWDTVYKAVKGVDPRYRLGGPSTARCEWIRPFVKYASRKKMIPDYMISHIYNNDGESGALSPFAGLQTHKQSKNLNFAKRCMKGVKNYLDEINFKGELHFNEWGRSWLPVDPVRETAYEAAYICKTMNEVSQDADYFAYWCLSDIYDQAGYGAAAFHGNYGMLSLQGLRKPSYMAHLLLNMLGCRRYDINGEGLSPLQNAIVTDCEKEYSILVHSMQPEYAPRSKPDPLKVKLCLPEKYSAKTVCVFTIDVKHNNIIHDWQKAGAPAQLTPAMTRKLADKNFPVAEQSGLKVSKEKDGYYLEFRMASPGVRLVKIKKSGSA